MSGKDYPMGNFLGTVWNIRVKNPNQFYIARKTSATTRLDFYLLPYYEIEEAEYTIHAINHQAGEDFAEKED